MTWGVNQSGGIDANTRELCVIERLDFTVKNGAVAVIIVFLVGGDAVEMLVVVEEQCVCLKK